MSEKNLSEAGVIQIEKISPPEPNKDLPSKFVLECLDTENEGDGTLYAALLKNKMLYAKSSDSWFQWDKHCWVRDRIDTAVGLVC